MRPTQRVETGLERLEASIAYALSSPLRVVGTLAVAVGTFGLLVASAYPRFAVRMFVAGPDYWVQTLRTLVFVFGEGAGAVGVVVGTVYAALTGVLAVVVAGQLRTTGPSRVANVSGAVPGVLASGCASCGAGVLGLMGTTGAVAALPFHGNGLRALGVAVLAVLLARIGDPRRCRPAENGS